MWGCEKENEKECRDSRTFTRWPLFLGGQKGRKRFSFFKEQNHQRDRFQQQCWSATNVECQWKIQIWYPVKIQWERSSRKISKILLYENSMLTTIVSQCLLYPHVGSSSIFFVARCVDWWGRRYYGTHHFPKILQQQQPQESFSTTTTTLTLTVAYGSYYCTNKAVAQRNNTERDTTTEGIFDFWWWRESWQALRHIDIFSLLHGRLWLTLVMMYSEYSGTSVRNRQPLRTN